MVTSTTSIINYHTSWPSKCVTYEWNIMNSILFSHFDSNDNHDYTRILLVDTKCWIINQDQVNTDNRPLSTRTLTGSLVHFFARARGLLKVSPDAFSSGDRKSLRGWNCLSRSSHCRSKDGFKEDRDSALSRYICLLIKITLFNDKLDLILIRYLGLM